MSHRILGKLAGQTELVEITIQGRAISGIQPARSELGNAVDGANSWIASAFFDVQVNGFAGIDFNSPGLSSDAIWHAIAKLREKGVVFFCPTVITHSFEHLAACLGALNRVCREPAVASCIPAIHLEGPWISREDGPRGAHPLEHARNADWEEFLRLQESAGGRIGMVTLAPEVPGALAVIEKLVAAGIVVAIGHTAASPETIRQAVQAGARMCTHLGNGSHLKMPRHQNYVWEQLAADDLWASFIVDGHHLPPSVVKCMVRAKGGQRSILTSDAIAAAGMPPGRYKLGAVDIVVQPNYRAERVDGAGSGILAGSAIDLLRGVENVIRFAGVSLSDAITMASANPARLMGLSSRIGIVEPGRDANLIVFEWKADSGFLQLQQTIMEGQVVYDSGKAGVA
ncbi:MAG TPA: amidohydrolase family protein [Terriglobia bacterium]|nr:amidohydrolase family protein [Terriglobia bacterium]